MNKLLHGVFSRLLPSIVLLFSLQITIAFAVPQEHVEVSVDIPIPDGYSEMLVPSHHGWMRAIGSYSNVYPSSHHNMQFMAFRNPVDGKVFYVQTTDPDGQYMEWKVASINASYTLSLTTYSLDSQFPANFYFIDNSLIADSDEEFYRIVAIKYKEWALSQKWAKRKSSIFDKFETFTVVPDLTRTSTTSDSIENDLYPYTSVWNGAPTAAWVTFWRKYWRIGIDGGVPDYRGNTGSQFIDPTEFDVHNIYSFPYTNALLWDSRIQDYGPDPVGCTTFEMNNGQCDYEEYFDEIYHNNPAAAYQPELMLQAIDGSIVSYENRPYLKHVCPATNAWKTTFVNQIKDNIASQGWHGIYYDMAAFVPPRPCYAHNHGHDLADPIAWQNGIRDILTTLKSSPETKHLAIIAEGNAEVYMDLVDAFLTYAHTNDNSPNLGAAVPLFNTVYGEVIPIIGWQALPHSNPKKSMADLTPAILKRSHVDAANFGSSLYASPAFFGWDAQPDIKKVMVNDPSYSDLHALLSNSQYKIPLEKGAGASNWKTIGAIPVAANEFDIETGGSAVAFFNDNRDASGLPHYQLEIDSHDKFNITWDMQTDKPYYILLQVIGTNNSIYYNLLYDGRARAFQQQVGSTLKIGLGADTQLGNWKTIIRDVAADFHQLTGDTLTRIREIRYYGDGLLDNIYLYDTPNYVFEDGAVVSNWDVVGNDVVIQSDIDSETADDVIKVTGITSRDDGKYIKLSLNGSKSFELSWDMKTATPYYFLVGVTAESGEQYNLLYDGSARDFRKTVGITVKVGLGSDTDEGDWVTSKQDLAVDLLEATGESIASVREVRFYGSGSIDNIRA